MSQIISQPKVSVIKLRAANNILNVPHKVLFTGQKTAAGSAVSGQLYSEIANDNSWDTLFGANSMLAGMIRAARAVNDQTRFDAIPLDDSGTGVAATGTVTFSGTATEDGILTINIGSRNDYSFELAVSDTDTATIIGDALEAAVNGNTNIPITASNATGTVTLTADNKGTEFNSCSLEYQGSVAGVTVTLTAFASGANDPDLTNIFDVVGSDRYATIIFPYGYGTTFITDFLDPRWQIDNIVLDGIGIASYTDTLANIKTAANLLNSQNLGIHGNKLVNNVDYKGSALFEFDYIIASIFGAVRALRLTQDANISRYVVTTEANDQIGSPSASTLPYFNTPLFTLPSIDNDKGFTADEIEELLDAGVFVIGDNIPKTNSLLGEVVTTYKTDSVGNPDVSFTFMNYVDTISNIAEYFFNNLKADYAQSRLTEGDIVQGYSMANATKIAASLDRYYKDLAGDVYLLVENSEASFKFFKDNRTIVLDTSEGKVTVSCKVVALTQLREITATIKLAFTTQG